jgi:hypothetical protein
MDESLQELENELKRLRPQSLPDPLLQRIERDLGPARAPRRYTTATSLRSWKWAGWSLAGAAALAIGFFALNRSQPLPSMPATPVSPEVASAPTAAPAVNRYEPVRASSVLYEMKDDGMAYLPDRTPARQVRYRYVDTYTWKNPATKASLKWSVPRDEVRVVQASLD